MMATDYQAIRNDNIQKYGTDIERIGPMLLSDRYADSAHFIFELLQNTEDALKRRKGWDGPKSVSFDLSNDSLRVSHFGQPFTKLDVNGICGIGEGTKDITEIGEFGIGFKSVYEITNRPEIHSGEEDFAIESYVRPVAVDSISRENDQTVIILPLKERNYSTVEMITSGLNRLSLSALLFLRQIDSISWTVVGSGSGTLIRETTTLSTNVRRVELLGQIPEIDELHENWLIFSKPIVKSDKELVGHVEIAFSAERDKEKDEYRIKRVERSPLVAFFPTALETNLGFLIQGPYRTTPSRDNVPPDKPWNQQLVKETAALLIDSLKWLRKENMLNINILRCLPIHAYKFQDGNMFSPIFHATKLALLTQSLLPKLRSGFTSAQRSRLGRTQEIRDLLTSKQLADLYGESGHIAWLSADITLDRTPDLRSYLIEDLGMRELVPASVLELLDGDFLTVQTDAWIRRFYEFLNKQTGLHKRLGDLPLIRLVDGEHIAISTTTTHGVFLPGTFKSDFPTVRPTVCNTDGSREFLIAMGFHPPDPVDDVILNLLPKYNAGEIDVDEDEYTADIQRIIASFETDSKTQREKLLSTLKTSAFVMAVEGASGERYHITPDSVYIASDRLKDLFQGVADVYLIDSSYDCLHGDKARELLEACGAVRYLKPMKNDFLDWELRKEIREGTGHTESSGRNDVIVDWKIRGLDELLESLSKLDAKQRAHKAKLLWEELVQLEERRGKTIFTGEYTWTHNGSYKTNFDPSFVKKLNNTSWVPDGNGELVPPGLTLFNTLNWKPHPFLMSKIKFKPPILETLALEAGIDPDVLDLLKRLNLTNVEELRTRLGIEEDERVEDTNSGEGSVDDALHGLLGDIPEPSPGVSDSGDLSPRHGSGQTGGRPNRNGSGYGGTSSGRRASDRGRTGGGKGRTQFVSYVATHPLDEEEYDPDDLAHEDRLYLEEKAICLILDEEIQLKRTPVNNPGYDLFECDENDKPIRWIEVKAMTGGLENRPVGLSHTQFDCAREHGLDFWLYIVEYADNPEANIIRIQDPAGKARTYTFDHGWINAATEKPKSD